MPKLTINLNEVIRQESDADKRRAFTRASRSEAVKLEFGARVVDEIVRRTQEDNVDKAGRKFRKYSKAYINSTNFKIAGKEAGKVDLTLSGDMLGTMQVLGTAGPAVTIGWNIAVEDEKAGYHVEGTGKMPKRDFFGMPKGEQYKILKSVLRDLPTETIPAGEIQTAVTEAIDIESLTGGES